MQRSCTLVSLFFALVHASLLFAQSPSPMPAQVCVTVSFNAAVLQTAEARRMFGDLQSKFAPRQTHLQQLNAQLEAHKKQIDDGPASLSEAEKATRLRTLETEERQLQRDTDDFKGDADSASQQAFQSVAQKVYAFLQDYAKQHAYSIVIDRGTDAAPVVLYAAVNVDITAELIKAYDSKAAATPGARTNTNPQLPSAPVPR